MFMMPVGVTVVQDLPAFNIITGDYTLLSITMFHPRQPLGEEGEKMETKGPILM